MQADWLCGGVLGLVANEIRGHKAVQSGGMPSSPTFSFPQHIAARHSLRAGSVLGAECSGLSYTDTGSALEKSANEWGDRQINEQTEILRSPAWNAVRMCAGRGARSMGMGQEGSERR